MAGFNCVERAIAHGDDPSNHGNGYELRITLNSGVQIEGAVADLISNTEAVKLQRSSGKRFLERSSMYSETSRKWPAAELIWGASHASHRSRRVVLPTASRRVRCRLRSDRVSTQRHIV